MPVTEELQNVRRMLINAIGHRYGQADGEGAHNHPSDDSLADYAADDVDAAACRLIARHLAVCPGCAEEEERLRSLAGRWAGDYGARRLTHLGASILRETEETLRRRVVHPAPVELPAAANAPAGVPAPAMAPACQLAQSVEDVPTRPWRRATAVAASAAVLAGSLVFYSSFVGNDLQERLDLGLNRSAIGRIADGFRLPGLFGTRRPDGELYQSLAATLNHRPEHFLLQNQGFLLFSEPAKVWATRDRWWVSWSSEVALRDAFASLVNPSEATEEQKVVFFEHGRSNLSTEAMSTIQIAVATYMTHPGAKVVVIGHTDTAGSDTYNLNLSQRRANAVMEAMSRLGVPASAFQIVAKGEQEAPVLTGQGVREAQNRRTDILIQWTALSTGESAPVTMSYSPVQPPAKPNQSASKIVQPSRNPSASTSRQISPIAKPNPTGRYGQPPLKAPHSPAVHEAGPTQTVSQTYN